MCIRDSSIIAAKRTVHDSLSWTPGLPNVVEFSEFYDDVETAPGIIPALLRTTPGPAKANVAHVQVRHIHVMPVNKADVTVHLFAWKNPPYKINGTPVALENMPLTPAIRNFILTSVQSAPPAAQATDKLLHLGSSNPPTNFNDEDPRHLKFEFDLDYGFEGARADDTVILIALVDSPIRRLTAADLAHPNLMEVIRHCPIISSRRFSRE